MSAIVSNLKEFIVSCIDKQSYDAVPKDNYSKVVADYLMYEYFNNNTCRNVRLYDRERVLCTWFAMRELLLKKFELPTMRDVVKSMQEYPKAFNMLFKELLEYDIYNNNEFVHNYIDDSEEHKKNVDNIVYTAKELRKKYCSAYGYPDVSELPVEMSASLYDDTIVTLMYRSADDMMTILIEYLQGSLNNIKNNDYDIIYYGNSKKYYFNLLNAIGEDMLDYIETTPENIQNVWYTVKAFVTYNCCDFTNDKEFIEEFNKKNPRLAEKYHILYKYVDNLVIDCVTYGGAFKFSDITIDLPELIE